MKKFLVVGLMLTFAVIVVAGGWADAQEMRSIVPSPRGIELEAVDPVSKTPMRSYCIGPNAIDVKLTNNSNYRKYVYIVNRDTGGTERTLYQGWVETGTHYLSELMGMQLELAGPAGTETVRADTHEYGQTVPGNWVSFYVQDCGGNGQYPGPWQPNPWPGQYAQISARVTPYAIEQGKKGTVILQTGVGSSYQQTAYYFEILNSWGQLWKRLPVSKAPYQPYRITLPVGTKTKTGMLTYTVNLLSGENRKVATTRFSFRVITPGSAQTPYYPGYPGYQGYPSYPGGMPYGASPYSDMSASYGTMPNYGQPYMYGQGVYGFGGYPSASTGERQIQ